MVVLALAGAAGWMFRVEIALFAVEKMMASRGEIGPTQQIEWATGSDPEGRVPDERPPNVVLILADDLGWNDISMNGGADATAMREGGETPHEYLFFRSGAAQAVRDGRWKLVISAPPEGEKIEWLFDLHSAEPEREDLLAEQPAIASRLRTALDAHNTAQAEPRWPWTLTTPINLDRDLSQPDEPDDEFAYWSN